MIQPDPIVISQHIFIDFRQLQLNGIFIDFYHPLPISSFVTNSDHFLKDSVMLSIVM